MARPTSRSTRRALAASVSMSSLVASVLAVPVAVASSLPPAGVAVLGVEAERPVRAWIASLDAESLGAPPGPIRIARDRVSIGVGEGCTWTLHHPSAGACEGAVAIPGGDAVACAAGDRCPAEDAWQKAAAAAGALDLPWKAAPSASGASPQSGPGPVEAAMADVRKLVEIEDFAKARGVLASAARVPKARARDKAVPIATLASLGGGPEAQALLNEPGAPGGDLGAVLTIATLMGPELAGKAAVAALRAHEMGSDACALAAAAAGFELGRRYEPAAALARAVRAEAPSCLQAYVVEGEAWIRLRREPETLAIYEAANARFPGHPWLTGLRDFVQVSQGGIAGVAGRMEAQLAKGERPPGLIKNLLALLIRQELRLGKMAEYLAKAEADPEDDVAAFLGGVLLHYRREPGDWARSTELLMRSKRSFGAEPRMYIYLAMNAFNLGDRAKSEEWIAHSASLEMTDPDVHYCHGEIFRDTDRPRALEHLRLYWHQTAFTSDPVSKKQKRVKSLIDALGRCIAEGTPGPCDADWEHEFGSAKDQRQPGEAPTP